MGADGRAEDGEGRGISAAGTLFLEQIDVYRELLGEAVVDEALAAVAPEVRSAYETCVPGAWIDVHVSAQLYAALARAGDRDPVELHDEVVRIGYTRALKGLWRALIMRMATDRAIVARAPVLYAKTFDGGEMRGELEGPGRATFQVLGWPDMPELHQVGIASGMRAVLVLSGRKDADVQVEPSPEGPRFRARWR